MIKVCSGIEEQIKALKRNLSRFVQHQKVSNFFCHFLGNL